MREEATVFHSTNLTPAWSLPAALFAAILLIPAMFTATSAAANDSLRMKQLRLLCVQLSGDLTEPGGIAAFRRCLSTHDPLNEIRRDNGIGGARPQRIVDRPAAAPPRGFGRNSRSSLAQQVLTFQTTDGKVIYVIAADGRLWRSTLGTKDARVVAPSATVFRVTGDGHLFVIDHGGALSRANADGSSRIVIDAAGADFQSLGDLVYVQHSDGSLWRENVDGSHRTLVDRNIKAFQAIDGRIVFVLGQDGKLWRETGDMNSRMSIAGSIRAFQYIADGDTVYVLTTADGLWRQRGKQKPEQVDHDVAAFRAADMNLVFVLGQDGRLWQELGNRDQAVLVDRDVMIQTSRPTFEVLDAQHLFILDNDRKLWAEAMPPGR
jgi:outer membrane protein assembly factor BamB